MTKVKDPKEQKPWYCHYSALFLKRALIVKSWNEKSKHSKEFGMRPTQLGRPGGVCQDLGLVFGIVLSSPCFLCFLPAYLVTSCFTLKGCFFACGFSCPHLPWFLAAVSLPQCLYNVLSFLSSLLVCCCHRLLLPAVVSWWFLFSVLGSFQKVDFIETLSLVNWDSWNLWKVLWKTGMTWTRDTMIFLRALDLFLSQFTYIILSSLGY